MRDRMSSAFGAVLYEMITGRRAFTGATQNVDARGNPDDESRTRRAMWSLGLPRDLEKLILRCLRKNPERRWQSMADLKVALEDLRDESGSQGVTHAAGIRAGTGVEMDARSRSLAIAAIGALAFGGWWRATRTQPEGGPRAVSDPAHVRRRLDRLSSHLTRWKDSRVRIRSRAATTIWISGCSRFQTAPRSG